MAGTPIAHTTLVPGATVAAVALNNNFEAINTYLDGTGLENQYIKNSLHNICWTWHVESVASLPETRQIGFKVPSTFSSGTGTFLSLQVFLQDSGAPGSVTVNLHNGSAFPPTSSTKLVATAIVADADGELTEATTFTTATFAAGDTFYIEYVAAGNSVTGITISLFAKADNRS